MYPNAESTLSVYLGIHNVKGTSKSRKLTVKKIIKHASYCWQTHAIEHDIAIIKINEAVKINKNIGFSCLPPINDETYPTTHKNIYVIGWGKTNETQLFSSNELNEVELSILNSNLFDKCRGKKFIICAGDYHGGKDSKYDLF